MCIVSNGNFYCLLVIKYCLRINASGLRPNDKYISENVFDVDVRNYELEA